MVIVLNQVPGGLVGMEKIEALDPALEGKDLYFLSAEILVEREGMS